ncbi:MAG: hypothetical protein ACREM8_00880 [Vulcanimicrobiaceae bacterium]
MTDIAYERYDSRISSSTFICEIRSLFNTAIYAEAREGADEEGYRRVGGLRPLNAWFEDRADEEADDGAEDRSDERDDAHFASDSPAVLAEREKAGGDEECFDRGADDRDDHARDDADEDIIGSPPHYGAFRFG